MNRTAVSPVRSCSRVPTHQICCCAIGATHARKRTHARTHTVAISWWSCPVPWRSCRGCLCSSPAAICWRRCPTNWATSQGSFVRVGRSVSQSVVGGLSAARQQAGRQAGVDVRALVGVGVGSPGASRRVRWEGGKDVGGLSSFSSLRKQSTVSAHGARSGNRGRAICRQVFLLLLLRADAHRHRRAAW
jgi:hypothetical protein